MSRRLPAYGRELLELRLRGDRPAGYVVVALNSWRYGLGGSFKLVIPADTPVDQIDFRLVHGLDVLLVDDGNDDTLVDQTADAIAAQRPNCLHVMDMRNNRLRILLRGYA